MEGQQVETAAVTDVASHHIVTMNYYCFPTTLHMFLGCQFIGGNTVMLTLLFFLCIFFFDKQAFCFSKNPSLHHH